MTAERIEVVVVDDHPVFRIGMSALLDEMEQVHVVGQAASQAEAVEVVLEHRPQVVVMDLDLGGGSGAEATREILRHAPDTGILVVTMFGDDDALFGAIKAGARGYLVKGAGPDEVERAVRAVAEGSVMLGPQVAGRAVAFLTGARSARGGEFAELTERERDVLELLARGHDNTTIARMLVLTPKTVRNYVYAIFTKLDVNDRSALVVKAREAGIGVSRPEG
ncbi:response regulator transcription factor [Nocardioides sp. SYSU D00038]|uniref:response regulator n=1 Tax=Nocardioides sp. SYSU D00038 TaxID=2812554 RepID=UPI0019688AB3|nr:response regulator transcription factor [Nocardioides sp. SYSU D00038]